MADLWLTVFDSAAEVALGDPLEVVKVTIAASSTQSAALTTSGLGRKRVRFFADADCYVAWGENPTASSGTTPLGSENPEFMDVQAGHKVAVIERA